MQDQTTDKPAGKRTGSTQIWLLPICFLLAIILAVLILKPQRGKPPALTETPQQPAKSVEAPIAEARQTPAVTEAVNNDAKLHVPRFVKLSATGTIVPDDSPWACVLDREQELIWEVKTDDGSWQDREFTFSWYAGAQQGGEPLAANIAQGLADGGACIYISCDTAAYIKQMNMSQICAKNNWRLPLQQELGNLDHPVNYHPDIDTRFFPHTMPGLYWSGSTSAKNKSLAFAVDFNNNIGYATEKRLAHHIRAVADVE